MLTGVSIKTSVVFLVATLGFSSEKNLNIQDVEINYYHPEFQAIDDCPEEEILRDNCASYLLKKSKIE